MVDNPWLPLEPGATARFDVREDGADVGSIETAVLDEATDVGGLAATGITTAYDVDGRTDITTRYYAQDAAGASRSTNPDAPLVPDLASIAEMTGDEQLEDVAVALSGAAS